MLSVELVAHTQSETPDSQRLKSPIIKGFTLQLSKQEQKIMPVSLLQAHIFI